MLLDAYIRVSQVAGREGESFISPALQREQIERWLALNGARLGRVFEELDQSGGRPDRPLLEEALARVESGRSDGIIVAKLDRFGRSVQHGLAAIARIEQAGGVFVSVQEGVDMSTPAGRLMIRMMFSFGEWELDHSRESWRLARIKAVERGQYLGPLRPLGYRRGPDGRLRIDPLEAPTVAEVFRQRALAIPSSKVAAYLNNSPLELASGCRFTHQSVWRITKNRVYLGETHSNGVTNRDAHAPIVDRTTWEQAQHPGPDVRPNAVFLLSGLIRCASCGYTMVGHRQRTKHYSNLIYRCNRNRSCPDHASARAEELEPLVEQLIARALPEDRRVTHWEELPIAERRDVVGSQLDCLYVEPGLEEVIGRAWVVGDGSGERKRAHHPPFSEASRSAKRLATLRRWPKHELAESLERFLAGRESWPDFETFARAGQAQLHAQAMLWGGVYHWAPRFDLEIPRLRNRFDPRLLEGALGPFLEGRTEWPNRQEFEQAGLAKVRAAVRHHGGAAHWAQRFGLTCREHKRKWTMERIERELVVFTEGRTTFPTEKEFKDKGRRNLHAAVRIHGGLRWWAERLGLRLTTGLKGRPIQGTGQSRSATP